MEAALKMARDRWVGLDIGLVRKGHFAKNDKISLGDGAFCVGVYDVKGTGQVIKVTTSFEQCEEEWKLIRSLDHPNIVRCPADPPVRDVLLPFFRLERVRGFDLLRLLQKREKNPAYQISAAGIRHVLQCLARALTAIHAADIVHRDVKAENLLLSVRDPRRIDESVEVRLCDFNLSHRGDAPTHYGGSVVSMSPEVMEQKLVISSKSDVFGFGVLSYALVTGFAAFVEESMDNYKSHWEKLHLRVHNSSEFASQPALHQLTLRALSWEPDARPSADELVKSNYFLRHSPALRKARLGAAKRS